MKTSLNKIRVAATALAIGLAIGITAIPASAAPSIETTAADFSFGCELDFTPFGTISATPTNFESTNPLAIQPRCNSGSQIQGFTAVVWNANCPATLCRRVRCLKDDGQGLYWADPWLCAQTGGQDQVSCIHAPTWYN